ncbi:S-adenosyl-L-methionine-dependent methyltransferase [Phlyctochytrium arcticum]|nr:S-adenosyl-L-methionine-dependent methyltransferase [Phlyctochytrium arcticum]
MSTSASSPTANGASLSLSSPSCTPESTLPEFRRPEESLKKTVSSVSDFGTRYLEKQEDVFDFNAWDNVDWDETQENEALEKIAVQAEHMVPEDQRQKYEEEAAQFWDEFYTKNTNKFFKDRHWLRLEFPEIFENLPKNNKDQFRVLEMGCGAGNTVFPLLKEAADANVFVYACDYSKVAVDVVKSSPEYDEKKCHAFVYDITSEEPPSIEPNSIDVCVCIFVLSAIHPNSWSTAVGNIWRALKPGGLLLFRDYGRYDLAQLRFKSNRMLEPHFYIRGDGTRVYFFDPKEIEHIFKGFQIEQNAVDRRLLVNRSKKLKMYRVWLQGKFRKPLDAGDRPTPVISV